MLIAYLLEQQTKKSLISHAFSIFHLTRSERKKKQISEAINYKYFQINEAHACKIYGLDNMNVYLVVHNEGNMRKGAQKH